MNDQHTIAIRADGTLEFIDNERVATLLAHVGEGTAERVSHVEPINRILRVLFYEVRSRVHDRSVLANWTRRWRCRWQAQLIDGPLLGPFTDRQDAISAEIDWLETNRL